MYFWAVSAAAAGMAGWSVYADRRRMHRANPDKVGFVPWPSVLMVSILVAIIAAVLATKS